MFFFKSNWFNWLIKTRFIGQNQSSINTSELWLNRARDVVLSNSEIKKTDTVADIGTGTGLLGIHILQAQQSCGNVIFIDKDKKCIRECERKIKSLNITGGYKLLLSSCENIKLENSSVDKVVSRSVLCHILNRNKTIQEIYRILKNDGIYCGLEPVLSENIRFWQLVDSNKITDFEFFKDLENHIWTDNSDSLFNYNSDSLVSEFKESGFTKVEKKIIKIPTRQYISPELIDIWFSLKPAPDKKNLKERYLKYTRKLKFNLYINELKQNLINQTIETNSVFVLVKSTK